MQLLETVIRFLQFQMPTPTMYGWFHLLALFLVLGLTLILRSPRIGLRRMLLGMSLVMLALELYKQLSFSYAGGQWVYQWYAFPFQFCSVPMYVMLLAGLTRNEKLAHSLRCFLATYSLTAGIAALAYPATLFIPEVLINIQTMVHHGLMVTAGLVLILRGTVRFSRDTLAAALPVFLCLVFIAVAADIATYYAGIGGGLELFYISPFHLSQLPVFSAVQAALPYPLFLLVYITVFTLGSMVPLGCFAAFKRFSSTQDLSGAPSSFV